LLIENFSLHITQKVSDVDYQKAKQLFWGRFTKSFYNKKVKKTSIVNLFIFKLTHFSGNSLN